MMIVMLRRSLGYQIGIAVVVVVIGDRLMRLMMLRLLLFAIGRGVVAVAVAVGAAAVAVVASLVEEDARIGEQALALHGRALDLVERERVAHRADHRPVGASLCQCRWLCGLLWWHELLIVIVFNRSIGRVLRGGGDQQRRRRGRERAVVVVVVVVVVRLAGVLHAQEVATAKILRSC